MSWQDILKKSKVITVSYRDSKGKEVKHKIPLNKFDDYITLTRKEKYEAISNYLKERPRFDFQGNFETLEGLEKPNPFKKDKEGNYVYSEEERKRMQERLQ